ncbi:MAG: hypothetical protein AAF146_16195, partial [Bacteroidota bacterium]
TKILTAALVLTTALLLSACTNVEKLVDSGNYEEAIAYSVKKLRGKNKKKQKHVLALEKAFNKANQRDIRRMEVLKKRGSSEDWEEVYQLVQNVDRRQRLVEPLLPVIDREGYRAEFKFVKVANLENESRNQLAVTLYEDGQRLLTIAQRDRNKSAAREAYRQLNKIERYQSAYRDTDYLLARARQIGTTRIRFKMDNSDSPVVLPRRFQEEVLAFGADELNTFWNEFYVADTPEVPMDFEVVMKVSNVAISPERIKEVEYIDREEVEDGFEYVLDENGNVMKDTLGNDIKIPRYRFVEALVFETFQHKEVRVEARLEYVDLRNRNLIDSDNLGVAAVFENYASTYRGDPRALSARSRRCIGKQPLPFPATEHLLIQAAEQLKPAIRSNISNKRLI